MLTAFLFDERVGEPVTEWETVSKGLQENQVLWVDVVAPSTDDERRVRETLGLQDEDPRRHDPRTTKPEVAQHEAYMRVTAIAAPVDQDGRAAVLECFVGTNWVVSVHADELEVIEDFRELASGAGELGELDGPSFLATLLEWVVTTYTRAFADIESTLETFDTEVLSNPDRSVEKEVSVLVEARQRVGVLRRALEPHRELFSALRHAELDLVSSETSARRFGQLVQRVDSALAAARDAKEAVVSSFDMLILRTEHRTNEIVKVLTLASILLLPGTLLAGLMGMNVNISPSVFENSPLFWWVVGSVIVIAAVTMAVARIRHWI